MAIIKFDKKYYTKMPLRMKIIGWIEMICYKHFPKIYLKYFDDGLYPGGSREKEYFEIIEKYDV